ALGVAAQFHMTRGGGHGRGRVWGGCAVSPAPPAEFQGQQAGHVRLLRRRELAIAERLRAHAGSAELGRSQQETADRENRQRFRYTHWYPQALLRGEALASRANRPSQGLGQAREVPSEVPRKGQGITSPVAAAAHTPRVATGPQGGRRPSPTALGSVRASSRGGRFRHRVCDI